MSTGQNVVSSNNSVIAIGNGKVNTYAPGITGLAGLHFINSNYTITTTQVYQDDLDKLEKKLTERFEKMLDIALNKNSIKYLKDPDEAVREFLMKTVKKKSK